ncbi:hypothetical protein QBC41DRAFT_345172 [Cercophora samala]|uniref:Uncharacterized protein n=1 Tax=Cercophora samala TaxID=330535 RepID=A0AA39ZGT9_9PEZI|nr:hypothetical protein QBC41DRAFT_345172 [Cercophora samala]
MVRIKTADGRIIHVQTGNPQTGTNTGRVPQTKHAQRKRLNALKEAYQNFISQTSAQLETEKESDELAEKLHQDKLERLEQQRGWNKLSDQGYRDGVKDLMEAKQQRKEAGKARRGFWKEMLKLTEDMEEEMDEREQILKEWKYDQVAAGKPETLYPDAVCSTFCTPKCLLGLKQGNKLDLDCPNVVSHRKGISGKHQISGAKLNDLVKQQLWREQDKYTNLECCGGCEESVPGQPERSRMGRFTLQPYGYTFLVKGYPYWWKRRAHHELDMFNRVESFHTNKDKLEKVLPFCFGLFDLPAPYPLPPETDASNWLHMDHLGYILLFSYGTVAGPKTCYPSPLFNEIMANKQLQTSVMGQYGIGFSKSKTGLSALWREGCLVAVGLDEGSIIRWRRFTKPGTRGKLERGEDSARRRVRRFRAKLLDFERRTEERKKRARERWVSITSSDNHDSAQLPDSLGNKLP